MKRLAPALLPRLFLLLLPLGGLPVAAAEAPSLPPGFFLRGRSRDLGSLPVEEEFITIKAVNASAARVHLIHTGRITREHGKPDQTTTTAMRQLAPAQCLALYEQAKKLGFFGLKDRYSAEEDGGTASSMSITADGVTKKISLLNRNVPAVDQLLARARDLARGGGRR